MPRPAPQHDSPFRILGTAPGCTGVPADHLAAEVTERPSLIIPMVFFDVRAWSVDRSITAMIDAPASRFNWSQ